MDDKWKEALRKMRVKIIQNLANPDCVADCLYADGVFNDEMKGEIEAIKTKQGKSRKILDTLSYRGVRSVQCLYNAFQQTSNEHLADELVPYVLDIMKKENLNDPKAWPPTEEEQVQMRKDKVLKIKQAGSALLHEYDKIDVYRMRNKCRGKVLMINNTNVKGEKAREGSDKDVENLKEVFEQLHFVVEIGLDLTAEEMVEFLKAKRDATVWEKLDCVILVLMSHGRGTCISGADGKDVNISDLLRIFSTNNCPDLYEKPRLVFVQACRVGTSKGIDVNVSDIKPKTKEDELDSEPSVTPISTQQSQVEIKHPSADFLVAFATPEGTSAYRHKDTGSWFINAVVWTLKYHALNEELHHLLIRVNRIVATGKTDESKFDPIYTVSEVKSNLRKKFYFFPGVYGDPPEFFD